LTTHDSIREVFDIPEEICYLNCAYMSPLAKPVLAAGKTGMQRKAHPWEISPADFFTETETCRERFAQLIGAERDDVALAPSVSYGITLASRNVPFGRGQSIAVLAEQFPSNVYPWQALARNHGGSIRVIERRAGETLTDAVLNALEDDNVTVAALPNCHWTDGAMLDLEVISACCEQRNIALVIDATQSLGALPLDVSRVRPAFLVCATYKWLLGPYSVAFVYAREDMQLGEPLEYSWVTRSNAPDFSALVRYDDNFLQGARRYDVGERSNFALLPMTIAALDLLLEWTPHRIQQELARYTTDIESAARAMGLSVASTPDRAGHFLGIRFPGGLPDGTVERFANEKVFVSVRGDSIRVTPHLYNTETDKERFLAVLEGVTQI
jgi:selenocysteine lyase/cysteine desulfurase